VLTIGIEILNEVPIKNETNEVLDHVIYGQIPVFLDGNGII